MRSSFLVLPLLLVGLTFCTQKKEQPTEETAQVEQTADAIVSNSVISWEGSKKVGKKHFGKISLKSANISMKDGMPSTGDFVIDMSTITVEDLEGEWATKFIGHIKSADFFDVANHPTSTLKVTGLSAPNKATGELTIKGKTNPVEIDFTEANGMYTGTVTIDRTKWEITYGSANFFKTLVADKIINDNFTVTFKVPKS